MKLLDRKTTNVLVSSQRKSQIDEGVALATRIDKLRATLLQLEEQQKSFVAGMQSELKKQTQPLHEKLSSLKAEIPELEERRKKLLEPLNEEWSRVREKMAVADGKEVYLNGRLQLLDSKESELDTLKKNLLAETRRLETDREAAQQNIAESEQIREQAEREAQLVARQQESVTQDLEDEKTALYKRVEAVAAWEREVEMRNELLDAEKEKLAVFKRQLEDKEATLVRNIKRLENGTHKSRGTS